MKKREASPLVQLAVALLVVTASFLLIVVTALEGLLIGDRVFLLLLMAAFWFLLRHTYTRNSSEPRERARG